jgi:uncharacterized protein HemX
MRFARILQVAVLLTAISVGAASYADAQTDTTRAQQDTARARQMQMQDTARARQQMQQQQMQQQQMQQQQMQDTARARQGTPRAPATTTRRSMQVRKEPS